jgi:hypothetical protein
MKSKHHNRKGRRPAAAAAAIPARAEKSIAKSRCATGPVYVPRSAKRLARAILKKNDPVEVASKLLEGEGDATMGRTFALLLEYLYGKPVQHVEASGPDDEKMFYQYVTYAPRLQHQLADRGASPHGDSGQPREDTHDGH